MWLPVIDGVIERRLLINYRTAPELLAPLLPRPFKPQLVSGYGLAGICLIRLGHVRPRGMPRWAGLRSENAAHRIAVEWEDGGQRRTGVYILRRDTNSRLNALAGGRVFPGVHHLSRFDVRESQGRYEINVRDEHGAALVGVQGEATDAWPADSVFGALDEASAFFAAGSLGYSPAHRPGRFDGLELRCRSWRVKPLRVLNVSSSLFDDERLCPRDSIQLDCGLLMHRVEHEWHSRKELCYAAADSTTAVAKEFTTQV